MIRYVKGPTPGKHGIVEPTHADARVADDIRALNLNTRQLVRGRAAVLDAAWTRLERRGFAASELRKLAQAHRIVAGTQVPEHAEFVRYHVAKKLRSLGHAP